MEIEVLLELIELIMTQKGKVGDFVETISKRSFLVYRPKRSFRSYTNETN
jgi:hypothetical protein